jgi:hypothetical protein
MTALRRPRHFTNSWAGSKILWKAPETSEGTASRDSAIERLVQRACLERGGGELDEHTMMWTIKTKNYGGLELDTGRHAKTLQQIETGWTYYDNKTRLQTKRGTTPRLEMRMEFRIYFSQASSWFILRSIPAMFPILCVLEQLHYGKKKNTLCRDVQNSPFLG